MAQIGSYVKDVEMGEPVSPKKDAKQSLDNLDFLDDLAAEIAGDASQEVEMQEAEFKRQSVDKSGNNPEKVDIMDLGARIKKGITRIPVASNGFALGILGISGVWDNAAATLLNEQVRTPVKTMASVAVVIAFLTYLMYFLKLVLSPRTVRIEWSNGNTLAAIAAAPMATCILASKLYAEQQGVGAGATCAKVFWWIGVASQLITMLRFIQVIIKERLPPATFYFPPLVSIAIVAVTGKAFVSGAVIAASFYAGVVVCVVALPLVTVWVVRKDIVAAGPAISLLQASPAFLTIAFFNSCDKGETGLCESHPAGPVDVFGPMFASLSGLYVLLTFILALRRKDAIVATWFTPAWAAWTFPTASSATASLLAARHYPGVGILTIYSGLMAVFATVIVVSVNVVAWAHWTSWLFWRRGSSSKVLSPSVAPNTMRGAALYAEKLDEMPLSAGYEAVPTTLQVNASTVTRKLRVELERGGLWRGRGWSVRVANLTTSAQAVHGFGNVGTGETNSKLNAGALPRNPKKMREALEKKGLFRNRGWSVRVANLLESDNAIHGFSKADAKKRNASAGAEAAPDSKPIESKNNRKGSI